MAITQNEYKLQDFEGASASRGSQVSILLEFPAWIFLYTKHDVREQLLICVVSFQLNRWRNTYLNTYLNPYSNPYPQSLDKLQSELA